MSYYRNSMSLFFVGEETLFEDLLAVSGNHWPLKIEKKTVVALRNSCGLADQRVHR